MKEEIVHLIIAELKDSISEVDKSFLKVWIEESTDNKNEYEKIRETWLKAESLKHVANINLDSDWLLVKSKLNPVSKSYRQQWAIAVSIAMLIGLSATFYFSGYLDRVATIGLTEYSTNQKLKTVTLDDGTIITLNSNSNLEINNDFGNKTRTVKLTGEAFFEVAKNPDLPFIVLAGNSTTKVLGTAFNLRASAQATTILVEHGKVSFGSGDDILLLEKEMGAQTDKDGLVFFIQPDINELAWKTGELKFKDEPITKVISTLRKHYKVSITTEGNLDEHKLTATFDNLDIEKVLGEICLIHQLSFQKTTQGYMLKKK